MPIMLKSTHRAAMAHIASELALQMQATQNECDTVARLVAANRALKEENAALRADAEKYRRSQANLKQFRKVANG